MKTWFVSRHPAAIEWAKRQAFTIDNWVGHLNPELVAAGDVVIGTLPVHLAEEVCSRGAAFYFLIVPLELHQRGKELDLAEMQAAACSVQRYRVIRED